MTTMAITDLASAPRSEGARISSAPHYAGFWRRAVAVVIDHMVVATASFTLFVIAALAIPGVATVIDASDAPEIATVKRTLMVSAPIVTKTAKSEVTKTEKLVETTVLGRWVYLHRITTTTTVPETGTTTTDTEQVRLDPQTRQEMETSNLWLLGLLPWLIYSVTLEASKYQATVGKMLIGIKVGDTNGNRLTVPRALSRVLLQYVSLLTLGIGFLMAGWTKKKQALHDKMTDCTVRVSSW